MAVAEVHPSVEELTAFALGTLNDEADAATEAHLAACPSCLERAAVAPGDSFLQLVCRVHARTSRRGDTFVEAAAQVQTPGPLSAVAGTDALLPSVALSAPAAPDDPEVAEAMPAELARHERYRVVRLLGSGGMGAVYEAEHRVMQRIVALKVIKRAYTASPAARERFRREVRAAARLSHLNVVTTYDAEDAGQTHFLVMEYVEGTDLGRLVREGGRLPVGSACEYVRQSALGLQYAFEQGMVHRDLKPHNLMLTPEGRVKVLDFGLACFASEAASAGVTGTGLVLGTVDYIAPEQADDARGADIRSDIYSLGCTLYHLLAGRPPFPAGTPLQKVMAHREKNPEPLTELRFDIPEGFMPVLERMMAKSPRDRYQTPAEVAIALEPFAVPAVIAPAPKPRPPAEPTDPDRTVLLEKPPVGVRRRRLVAVATALLFLAAGLLGGAVYRIATDKGELVITTESDDVKVVITQGGKLVDVIDTKTETQIRLALRSGVYELELEGAPKGLKLNVDKATLTRGKETLAKIERVPKPGDGVGGEKPPAPVGEIRRFKGYEAAVWSVTFSPDGAKCLTASADGTIRLWDVASGKELRCFRGHKQGVYCAEFSPNGKQIVSCSADSTVRLWDVESGKEVKQMKHDGGADWVAFSPDGQSVVSAGGNAAAGSHGDKIIRLWNVKTGEERQRFEGHTALVRGVAFSHDGKRLLSGGWDRTMRLWDVETGKELRRYGPPNFAVHCVAFSADDRWALSGGEHNVLLWDVESGEMIRRFIGHARGVHSVAFSADGRRALSGGGDGMRLWDVETGRELHNFEYRDQVWSVALSSNGRLALSGANDKTASLWRLPDPPPAKKKP